MRTKFCFSYVVFICSFGIFVFLLMTQNWKKCQSSAISQQVRSMSNFIETLEIKKHGTWIDDFQRVTNDDSMLVYSAFAEGRMRKIRVIGITNDIGADLHCMLWYNTSGVTTRLVKAFIADIYENHGKKHTAAYFICYLGGLKVPDAVSIVTKASKQSPRNILPVHVQPHLKTKTQFTLCLSPMHSEFNDSLQVLEWIELNKILGVEKFIIYVQNASSDVKNLLKYYQIQKDAEIHVFPWSLSNDLCNDTLLHYCGQLAALNDCLYRSKGYSNYIAATDLDELIIPQQNDAMTWLDMLLRLPDQSVYLFRHSFVTRDHHEGSSSIKNKPLMIDNFMRDDYIYGLGNRSKMIAWTDDVVTLGIHNVWAIRTGEEYGVNPNIGLLHHYRKLPVMEEVTVTKIKSNATMKYSHELKRRVDGIKKKVSQNLNSS